MFANVPMSLREEPSQAPTLCDRTFLSWVSDAAYWSAGCCDAPTLAERLVDIAWLAAGR